MKKLFFTAICIISCSILSAQVGINTSTPNPDAVLDVVSANKGFLPPRIALTSTISSSPLSAHVAGMVVYNTLTTGDVIPSLYYNDGTKWILLGNPGGSGVNIYNSDGTLTGNRTVTQGSNTLAFTGNQTNGFSVDGTTFSVDAANDRAGIGTITPQATLDVVGKPTVTTAFDGIIAPRITGNQLSPKLYTAAQTGAIIYATSADTTPSGQTVNVTSSGYYYFDGSVWVKFNSGLGSGVTSHTLVRSGNQMTSTITTPSGTFQGSSDIVAYSMNFNNATRVLTLTINGQVATVTIP